jgi:hypothetical protein
MVRYACYAFLLTFFGSGLLVFLNLFFHFLSEAAFAKIALVLLAEFALLFVIGKCVQVISAMRSVSGANKRADE